MTELRETDQAGGERRDEFHVEIVDANANPISGSPTGSQAIVVVQPLMQQLSTGQCVARPTNRRGMT